MQEKIIQRSDRFVTIKRYCEMTGLSWATVNHMLKTNQLRYITTESGLRRVDTQEGNPENSVLFEKIEECGKMLSALTKQFRTEV